MIDAATTIHPVRRLKQICEGIPNRAVHAAGLAGIYYMGSMPDGFVWQAIGCLPKIQIERILASAEKAYSK